MVTSPRACLPHSPVVPPRRTLQVIPYLTVYAVLPSSVLFLVAYSWGTQRFRCGACMGSGEAAAWEHLREHLQPLDGTTVVAGRQLFLPALAI